MNLITRIKALTLLFLVLGMMAHSAIPHVHHDHEVEHDLHATAASAHHHHEHSDHEHSLLVKLMETHSHESHVHEFLQLEFITPNYERVAISIVAELPDFTQTSVVDIDEETKLFQALRELHYNDPDLHSYSLRGPPLLG
jgi:hypothetical protein